MKKIKKLVTHAHHHAKKVPLHKWIIISGVSVAVLTYALVFFIPKSVQFSYAGATCVNQLFIAPGLQKPKSDDFTVTLRNEVKIGSVVVASTLLCFEPTQSPKEGTYTAQVAPLGGLLANKHFTVTVASPPVVNSADIASQTISTVQPLEIHLTGSDKVHDYTLAAANKEADCTEAEARLSCNVSQLALTQGEEYQVGLYRSFNGADKRKLAEDTVTTLEPLKITKASLKNKQVLYTMPKVFTFTTDHIVTGGEVTLEQVTGDTKKQIAAQAEADGKVLKVTLADDLARKASFILTLKQIVGDDGSSLAKSQTIRFTTSGGPKVTSVSVGGNSVNRNAQIIVTFDQAIADSVDVTKFAHLKGVNGSVRKGSNKQVIFSLSNAGQCAAFTLSVDKGVASKTNKEVSDAWNFNSRTICGTSSVIGYSVNGRPIIAYYFGSGANTVLYTGGMHGSEPSGQQTMQAWVNYLQAYGNVIPANRKVVVVPNTNPDGIAAGSRNNAHNVNIDRNFPTANWKANIDTSSGLLKNGGGKKAGSEPETKALMALTRQLRPRLEVSFHAQGSLVGANKFGMSVKAGDIYAGLVGYGTMYYNAEEVMGYSITGEFEDWMGEEMGIPAILIELPTASGNYLDSQLTALRRMLTL